MIFDVFFDLYFLGLIGFAHCGPLAAIATHQVLVGGTEEARSLCKPFMGRGRYLQGFQ